MRVTGFKDRANITLDEGKKISTTSCFIIYEVLFIDNVRITPSWSGCNLTILSRHHWKEIICLLLTDWVTLVWRSLDKSAHILCKITALRRTPLTNESEKIAAAVDTLSRGFLFCWWFEGRYRCHWFSNQEVCRDYRQQIVWFGGNGM